jgi:hypothetical protein
MLPTGACSPTAAIQYYDLDVPPNLKRVCLDRLDEDLHGPNDSSDHRFEAIAANVVKLAIDRSGRRCHCCLTRHDVTEARTRVIRQQAATRRSRA